MAPTVAPAMLFTFSGTGANADKQASVDFTVVGSQIKIVLTNTFTGITTQPNQVLTAVFWNVTGTPAWTKGSAGFTPGSYIVDGSTPDTPAQHWGFRRSTMDLDPTGGTNFRGYGLSATGIGLFDDSHVFQTGGGTPLFNGADFGLVGNKFSTTPMPSGKPLIFNSMTFYLNATSGFDLANLKDVRFLWGTDLAEFQGGGEMFPPDAVPEPASMAMAALGAMAAWSARRKLKAKN